MKVEGKIESIDQREENFALVIDGKKHWKFGKPLDKNGFEIKAGDCVVFDVELKTLESGAKINEISGDIEKDDASRHQTVITETTTKPDNVNGDLHGFLSRLDEFIKVSGEFERVSGLGDVALIKAFACWQVEDSKNKAKRLYDKKIGL